MTDRRQYSDEFRRQVVAETQRPGASIAGIALAHGVNTNLVHKWRRRILGPTRHPACEPAGGALIPIMVAETPSAVETDSAATETPGILKIELPRAKIEVTGRIDLDALQTVLAVLRSR